MGRPNIGFNCAIEGCSGAYYSKGLCSRHYHKQRDSNPEIKKRKQEWAKKEGKTVIQNGHLKRNYGITLIEYQEMLSEQNGKCFICHRKQKLCVDHCHKTMKVRKLLCIRCNTFVGMLEKHSELLPHVNDYIYKYGQL